MALHPTWQKGDREGLHSRVPRTSQPVQSTRSTTVKQDQTSRDAGMLRNRTVALCPGNTLASNKTRFTKKKKKKKKQIVPSRNSITSRACLVSLLLDFPFRLFFFPYHPMKMWRLSRGALPRLVPRWERPRYYGGGRGWDELFPLARRVIAILRQPNIFCLLFFSPIPVREWGGR